MILKILGAIDIIAALILLYPGQLSALSYFFGIIVLAKAAYSLISCFLGGFYADFMGFADLVAGISLLTGFGIPFLWLIMLLKGLVSMI